MTTHPHTRFRLLSASLLALALTAGAAAASPPALPAVPAAASPVFASYWAEFVEHWTSRLKQQNGVVVFALGVGAVSLFIITRGKWKK